VFNDFSIFIETEDVNAGPVAVARPLLIAVEDDEFTVGQDARAA
jgi:hypothetical protein